MKSWVPVCLHVFHPACSPPYLSLFFQKICPFGEADRMQDFLDSAYHAVIGRRAKKVKPTKEEKGQNQQKNTLMYFCTLSPFPCLKIENPYISVLGSEG